MLFFVINLHNLFKTELNLNDIFGKVRSPDNVTHSSKYFYKMDEHFFLNSGKNWFKIHENTGYCFSFFLQCMLWGWYLANDMQFYIISPAILFTAYRYEMIE